MVKSNGWKICVIVDDASTIWVWCSYWTFSFTIQRKLLQFYQAILLTPQSQLSVWGLIWEETDQVNMEGFGFSFLHELAARNLFEILIPTFDQIVFLQVQTANEACLVFILTRMWLSTGVSYEGVTSEFTTNNSFIWYFA